jgi:hypothetical protein
MRLIQWLFGPSEKDSLQSELIRCHMAMEEEDTEKRLKIRWELASQEPAPLNLSPVAWLRREKEA